MKISTNPDPNLAEQNLEFYLWWCRYSDLGISCSRNHNLEDVLTQSMTQRHAINPLLKESGRIQISLQSVMKYHHPSCVLWPLWASALLSLNEKFAFNDNNSTFRFQSFILCSLDRWVTINTIQYSSYDTIFFFTMLEFPWVLCI